MACILFPKYDEKLFSLYFKTKNVPSTSGNTKNVLSYSIFFFLLGMDKVLTLIIGTQIQMEFGKVLIIGGVLFFEDLYIFRRISTLKKLSFVGGPL